MSPSELSLERPLAADQPISTSPNTKLVDFWRWAYSDVLSNGVRAVLGEFLVGQALAVTGRPRIEWDPVDLRYGKRPIEVKTTSRIQALPPPPGSKAAPPRFDIKARRAWDPGHGGYPVERERRAACYVFCVYEGPPDPGSLGVEARRLAVLNVDHWFFLVMGTRELERRLGSQKSVTLSRLRAVVDPAAQVRYGDLRRAVDRVLWKELSPNLSPELEPTTLRGPNWTQQQGSGHPS